MFQCYRTDTNHGDATQSKEMLTGIDKGFVQLLHWSVIKEQDLTKSSYSCNTWKWDTVEAYHSNEEITYLLEQGLLEYFSSPCCVWHIHQSIQFWWHEEADILIHIQSLLLL